MSQSELRKSLWSVVGKRFVLTDGGLIKGKQDYGDKLSNSGELLKLLIPSHI
jgi:hypothetical protein